ncbi:MAG: putative quinol monooxygenase [Candidatus Competibacterales bacterium]
MTTPASPTLWVVAVTFDIHGPHSDDFCAAVQRQARRSLDAEADCLRFDVCRDPANPTRFFLYEIYRHPQAFQHHLASAHFHEFDAQVAPWVASKAVATWELLS